MQPDKQIDRGVESTVNQPAETDTSRVLRHHEVSDAELILTYASSFYIVQGFSTRTIDNFRDDASVDDAAVAVIAVTRDALPDYSYSSTATAGLPEPNDTCILLFARVVSRTIEGGRPPPALVVRFRDDKVVRFNASDFRGHYRHIDYVRQTTSSGSYNSLDDR